MQLTEDCVIEPKYEFEEWINKERNYILQSYFPIDKLTKTINNRNIPNSIFSTVTLQPFP